MLLAFSLALATAAAPALDDDDDDDDDDDPDRIVYHSAGHALTLQRSNASTL